VLIGLIGQEVAPIAMSAATVKPVSTDDLDSWERKIEQGVAADPSIRRRHGRALRLCLNISAFILLASRRGKPWVAPVVPAANTGLGFGIVGS
jgi:hypothetical protein